MEWMDMVCSYVCSLLPCTHDNRFRSMGRIAEYRMVTSAAAIHWEDLNHFLHDAIVRQSAGFL